MNLIITIIGVIVCFVSLSYILSLIRRSDSFPHLTIILISSVIIFFVSLAGINFSMIGTTINTLMVWLLFISFSIIVLLLKVVRKLVSKKINDYNERLKEQGRFM